MTLKFSSERGSSIRAQKLSSDILKFSNKFDGLIRKVQEKNGLSKHYERNKENYDLGVNKLIQAKRLMIEAAGHLMGGKEFYVM